MTALSVASRMELPDYIHEAMRHDRHPQDRTFAFHKFFGAPIHQGNPDGAFSHMYDQRVAFRAAFIMSECIELLEKGLGLNVRLTVNGQEGLDHYAKGSGNAGLTDAILAAMADAPHSRDLVEVIDALGDLNVVVNGFALELGVDMKVVDAEVFASNITKAGRDGAPIISDGTDGHPKGKIIKGPLFVEPQIASALGLLS